jgi:hypothetical protein
MTKLSEKLCWFLYNFYCEHLALYFVHVLIYYVFTYVVEFIIYLMLFTTKTQACIGEQLLNDYSCRDYFPLFHLFN